LINMPASSFESPRPRDEHDPIDPGDRESSRHCAQFGFQDAGEKVCAAQVHAMPFVARSD
jgi:hypothetical protein